MAPCVLFIGHRRASIQDCWSSVCGGYWMEKIRSCISLLLESGDPLTDHEMAPKEAILVCDGTSKSIHWKFQRAPGISSVTAHLPSAESKRSHRPQSLSRPSIFSPHPLVLCQISLLNGLRRLGLIALSRRALNVLNLQKRRCGRSKQRTSFAKLASNLSSSKSARETSSL